MTDRDRLIELMLNAPQIPCIKGGQTTGKQYQTFQNIADYLLANGVIVPPCKVGDYVLWDNGLKESELQMKEVKGIYYDSTNLGMRYILEDFQPIVNHSAIKGILTKKEAEAKLKECEQDDR